jgi:hypothetical protein
VLRKISGRKREEKRRHWSKLHNEDFHDFCSLFARYCRGDKLKKHVEKVTIRKFLSGDLQESDRLKYQGIGWRIILRQRMDERRLY